MLPRAIASSSPTRWSGDLGRWPRSAWRGRWRPADGGGRRRQPTAGPGPSSLISRPGSPFAPPRSWRLAATPAPPTGFWSESRTWPPTGGPWPPPRLTSRRVIGKARWRYIWTPRSRTRPELDRLTCGPGRPSCCCSRVTPPPVGRCCVRRSEAVQARPRPRQSCLSSSVLSTATISWRWRTHSNGLALSAQRRAATEATWRRPGSGKRSGSGSS